MRHESHAKESPARIQMRKRRPRGRGRAEETPTRQRSCKTKEPSPLSCMGNSLVKTIANIRSHGMIENRCMFRSRLRLVA